MRLIMRASIVGVIMAATMVSVAAEDKSQKNNRAKPAVAPAETVPASSQFTILKGVNAVPMASSELEKVKGLHVHFIDAGNGKLHLAGDVKHENNWANIGGTDGQPVAPSYKGLCVAHGNGAIFIPTGPLPVTSECP